MIIAHLPDRGDADESVSHNLKDCRCASVKARGSFQPFACVLLTLCASAIFATSSNVFTSSFLENRKGRLYRTTSRLWRGPMTTQSRGSGIADICD